GLGYPASGGLGDLNDLWKYDPATTNWTWIKGATNTAQNGTYGTQGVPAPANTPGARESAVSWTDGSGAVWLFGGYGYPASGGDNELNDLWKYDPATTNWTWEAGSTNTSQNGTYGTQGMPAAGNTPGARASAVSWADGSGALWLFGGEGYGASGGLGNLNDLWKYDPATTNWTWEAGANSTNQSGIYGTQGVPAATNTPGARYREVAWADGSGALWLFGGYGRPASGGLGYLNDLWKFDVFGGISLATNALIYSATFQGANPAAQMIGMTNVGGTAFTYTNVITYSAGASGWLTVLPSAGALALNGATILTNQVAIAGLGAGTYYATNQVVAADATNSPQTVVVTLTVNAPNQTPSAPTGVSAGDGTYTNKVLVTWNASSGATSYEVWRYTGNDSGAALKISSPDPTGTSYDDTSALAGATYYYWVKAVNAEGASGFSASDSGFLGVVGPLITANGLVGEVDINSGDPVTIAVQMMNIEPHLGVEVDWWVVAFAHSGGWYYLDNAMQWASFSGDLAFCQPVYQGGLVSVSSTPVLSGFILPPGTYDFWFAIDYPMDNILNPAGPILYDQVTVFVQ
ncbi:MAG: fibronectin type III domain-containing protein, partial [Lentisphaerae bacterium]|nr:fibronectin type III domain-containing protein [Lentisphaerota bacterium]